MNSLDSSFLPDYLWGEPYTRAYLEDHGDVPQFAPGVVAFELGYGALKHPSPERTLATVDDSLRWVEVVPFDDEAGREAVRIRDELRRSGNMIPTQDVMIAGVVRSAGGRLVTRDDDFTATEELDVHLLNGCQEGGEL